MINKEIPGHVLKYGSLMELSELNVYINKVYLFFERLLPGSRVQVSRISSSETRDLFIEVVKMYMDENAWQGGISFSNDYSTIRKVLIEGGGDE